MGRDLRRQAEKVLERTNDLAAHHWRCFHAKLVHGPRAVAGLLRSYDQARAGWLDIISTQFADARAINGEVLAMTKSAILDLARIKLASDLIVKLTPTPVGLPYSVATTFVKELHEAESANVVVFDVAKEPTKEGAKNLAEKGSHLMTREADGLRSHFAMPNWTSPGRTIC